MLLVDILMLWSYKRLHGDAMLSRTTILRNILLLPIEINLWRARLREREKVDVLLLIQIVEIIITQHRLSHIFLVQYVLIDAFVG